ncbi:MAG: hypothetical protein JNN05_03525 [Candidatus Omnitrophica bacterium]|nr:hypothetical protein [Candidatus Omnitrophota bacterium]
MVLRKMQIAVVMFVVGVACATTASAGLLDKLNQATKKLNDFNNRQQGGAQNQPQAETEGVPEDEDHPYDLNKQKGFKGSCDGKRSATCMDYMEAMDHCMDPVRGYRMKVLAERIEKKLKEEKLSDQQRKNLEEDLAAAKEAYKNKSDNPTIAGKKDSQRYLQDISEEDQIWVNAEFNKFNAKIMNKCEGADHMGIGKRREFIDSSKMMSGDQAIAEMKAQKSKDAEPFECLKKTQFVRWSIMADLMEKRMNEKNLQGQERTDWEADIASLREFAEKGEGQMPKPVDPSNPMRSMMRLTDPNDQLFIGQETARRSQEMMEDCQKKGPQRPKQKLSGTTSEVLAAKKKKAAEDAKNEAIYQKNKVRGAGGDSLSASLGATDLRYMKTAVKCYEPLKGHMAKVTADMLEKRLGEAKNLTAEKRKMWQEDIAAWRAAEAAGADQPDPPDPDNPYRWQDFVSDKDRQEINNQHVKFVNEVQKKCNAVNPML